MFRLIKKMEDMSDGQIRNEVSKGIAYGTIGKCKLNYIIRCLESKRPEIFNSDAREFEMIEERKDWDRAYLNLIHNSIVCGYFCKEILLHMEKVASKLLFKYKVGACVIAVVIMGIICFLISLLKYWGIIL